MVDSNKFHHTFNMAFAKTIKAILLVTISIMLVHCADEKVMPAPEVFLKMPEDGFEVNIDSTLIISPKITYDYETRYEWYENNQIIWTERDLPYTSDTLQTSYFRFKVISNRGSDSIDAIVRSLNIIHFDDLVLEKDTFWTGNSGDIGFNSNEVFFPTHYYSDSKQWDGFAYSNKTDKTTKNKYTIYTAYPGIGADKSKNYAVFHKSTDPTLNRIQIATDNDYQVRSIDVTNSIYVNDYIKNADAQNTFPDEIISFKLTIEGYQMDGTSTGKVEYNLATQVESTPSRYTWTINQSWYKLDLQTLGRVNRLEIRVNTNAVTSNIIIPEYVCLDNLKISD